MTWDSSKPNTYFALPLGRTLHRSDNFEFGFDLTLIEHRIGSTASKPGTFQIAAGLIQLEEATQSDFVRGNGTGNPDLVEWAWFGADTTISASLSPVITSTNHPPRWGYRDTYLDLELGTTYRFDARFTAEDSTLRFSMAIDGVAGPSIGSVVLPSTFTDFQVNAFSLNSYSDAGQDPRYAGSVFARAWIDQVRLVLPDNPSPVIQLTTVNDPREIRFASFKGWSYTLEGSGDLQQWDPIGGSIPGTDAELILRDTRKALFPQQFYRVRVQQP
jgi:hypothetical protein